MEQYHLRDKKGYYWIWFRPDPDSKPQLNGPHMEPMINLPIIEVENPLGFKPQEAPNDP